MAWIPKPQEIYRHFKGNLYQILTLAEHTETGEQLVVYQALYGEYRIYARALSQFVSRVDRKKYPDAAQEFRFEPVSAGAQGGASANADTVGNAAPEAVSTKTDSASGEGNAASAGRGTERNAALEGEETGSSAASEESDADGEASLDPLILEFLDADSYEQRLNILAALHHRITDEMITTMAVAADVEIADGDTQERYEALKNCLLTLERYECNRLR